MVYPSTAAIFWADQGFLGVAGPHWNPPAESSSGVLRLEGEACFTYALVILLLSLRLLFLVFLPISSSATFFLLPISVAVFPEVPCSPTAASIVYGRAVLPVIMLLVPTVPAAVRRDLDLVQLLANFRLFFLENGQKYSSCRFFLTLSSKL